VSVIAGSPAAVGGLRPEDVILDVDGTAISTVGDLQRLMSGERVGRDVTVRVLRNGSQLTVRVRPTELS